MRNCFLETILERAKSKPSALFAEVWKGQERIYLSWADLVSQALRYAKILKAHGVANGDVVFIIFKHDPNLYSAFLGTMLAGGVPSFLPFPTIKQDHKIYWKSHSAIFKRTSAACVMTYTALKSEVERACDGLRTKVITPSDLVDSEPLDTPIVRAGTTTALLQHSSGTTGLKKGVALTYDVIVAQLASYRHALGLEPETEDACVASWLPLYHDMGLITSFLMPMYSGFRLVSIDAFEWLAQPSQLFEAIESSGANLVWLPNFAFNHMARTISRKRRFDLSHVIAFINCSEPCKPASFEAFVKRFADEGVSNRQLQVCYAMAETTFAVTQTALGKPVRRLTVSMHKMLQEHVAVPAMPGELSICLLSNGPTVSGAEVKIFDGSGELESGKIGEIYVRSTSLFREYFADPSRTEASFANGWYKTGDLGFIDCGELFVIGRRKDMIIINGRNFYAHDIESVLADIGGVKPGRAIVFGVHSRGRGSEQVVVVAEAELKSVRAELPSKITNAIEKHYGIIPGDVRIVDLGWLLKTTSGKISRSANIEKYLTCFAVDAEAIVTFAKEN